MRFLMKVTIPTEAGNKAIREGALRPRLQRALEDLKPEAAYFFEEGGHRTALLVINMQDAAEIPRFVEPFFLGVDAKVSLHPAMTAEDLAKGGLDELAKKWG